MLGVWVCHCIAGVCDRDVCDVECICVAKVYVCVTELCVSERDMCVCDIEVCVCDRGVCDICVCVT